MTRADLAALYAEVDEVNGRCAGATQDEETGINIPTGLSYEDRQEWVRTHKKKEPAPGEVELLRAEIDALRNEVSELRRGSFLATCVELIVAATPDGKLVCMEVYPEEVEGGYVEVSRGRFLRRDHLDALKR
jgi:hypothetical protein